MRKRYFILSLGVMILVLSGSRIWWAHVFDNHKHIEVKNGQLDLQQKDTKGQQILLLDGEWEFYPKQLLMDSQKQGMQAADFIHVPDGWNEEINNELMPSSGYATYRLHIKTDPHKQQQYSIRVPSIRSSSELYVNDQLLASSGKPANTQEKYHPRNVPYSATFSPDENGELDIIIQAANYTDMRAAGIVRSIKFGTAKAMNTHTMWSTIMQLLAVIIFLVHAVYAIILYFLGNHAKKLLYFSLLTLCITLSVSLSSGEKVFHQLFTIGYVWEFRLTNIAIVVACYALLMCTDYGVLRFWRKLHFFYTIILFTTIAVTFVLPVQWVSACIPLYASLAGIAFVVSVIAFVKKVKGSLWRNYLLAFSITALAHHYVWVLIWNKSGTYVAYYPFDMIIAMGGFASLWFKSYFDTHAKTKKLASQLQRMNANKDQFLANTAHEFKNPLHSMLNMTQSVLNREKYHLKNRSINELETISSVGRKLSLILTDLLDVQSLREGNPKVSLSVIHIQPIVTAVLDMLRFQSDVKAIKINNQIPNDFPPVLADENRFMQIIFNLLHNAVKYTNDGEVVIRAAELGSDAVIVITDTGIGMDEEMLDRLFQPYEQAAAANDTNEGGFGLGLTITKQLIELHGGKLTAASALGNGTEFAFTLKLADEKQLADIAATIDDPESKYVQADQCDQSAAVKQLSKEMKPARLDTDMPCILVVDDDPVNLQVIEAMLPSDQYAVTLLTSGKKALPLLEQKEWDLVISDVMMPQMSGYELTQLIRRQFTFAELPVLLLTARSRPDDIQYGFQAGANDYVAKPVETIEIKSRIDALITIKRSAQEQQQLEAAWLQAQIQPHFIFNVLNSVIALSEFDLEKMRDLLHEFSSFLRYKFEFRNMQELIPLQDEINLVRSYLYIEKIRFADRLQVSWEIDGSTGVSIPFLTIQPLVENAIKHGIMQRQSGGHIIIRVSSMETYTEIAVEDDGVGMDASLIEQLLNGKIKGVSGVGIKNTNQRLKRHFGAGLQITSVRNGGTKVFFHIKK